MCINTHRHHLSVFLSVFYLQAVFVCPAVCLYVTWLNICEERCDVWTDGVSACTRACVQCCVQGSECVRCCAQRFTCKHLTRGGGALYDGTLKTPLS